MADAGAADASGQDTVTLRRLFDAQRDQRILVAIAAEDAAAAGAAAGAAFEAALRRDRVRISVAVPADRSPDSSLDRWSDDPRVVIDRVPLDAAPSGMAVLRSAARRRFDGEPFVLFVDAPVQFASGWDQRVIDALASADTERPLIDLAASQETARGSGHGTPQRIVGRRLVELAAPGRLCAEVAADEGDHDGSRLAVRAYTHGYDCFSAPSGIVRRAAGDEASAKPDARPDEGGPSGIGGLGARRTVAAFARLLAWSDSAVES